MSATRVGRFGLMAIGLGVGAAVAAGPGIAGADAYDRNDFSISIDGHNLFTVGSAAAYSGTGSIAIADGANSVANAGTVSGDEFDSAFSQGSGADSYAGDGDFNRAVATGFASDAGAGGDGPLLGNGDIADAFGANTQAESGSWDGGAVGNNDIALAVDPSGGTGDTAWAGNGDFDLASVLGDNSSAYAGVDPSGTEVGSFDFAVVLGDVLNALDASGGNWLVDILPSL
jgi:hypothetical protein